MSLVLAELAGKAYQKLDFVLNCCPCLAHFQDGCMDTNYILQNTIGNCQKAAKNKLTF